MNLSENIKSQIKRLPIYCGVYKFFDRKKNLIYVGKAKNLKKRVSSYFTKNHSDKKTLLLVKKIVLIKVITVNTELDALFLENNLIKKHQPKYNILLKDDKTYPWICIKNDSVPRIIKTRKIISDGSEYYGPYKSTKIIKILLDFFSHLFYSSGWTPFDYLKKKLSKTEEQDYLKKINVARGVLTGDLSIVFEYLNSEMKKRADNLEFEDAEILKNNILELKHYQFKSSVVSSNINNVDVFSLVNSERRAFVNYMRIINGAIVSSHSVEISKKLNETKENLLSFAITELRQKFKSNSKIIYSSIDVKNIWENVKIITPKIGDKKRLIELSFKNAKLLQKERIVKNELIRHKNENSSVLNKLKEDLGLDVVPKHIECFDNSNIQGENAVAACVVFKNAKPRKSEYRHFNIKTVSGIDDFKSMEEVVFRRISRLLKEKKSLPQLIIVDGGKGQLSAAMKSIVKLNLKDRITLIGIAKKLETIFFFNDKTPLYLNKKSPSLRLIQQLRNEAHRFGIKHHRNKRSANFLISELNNISGIGSKTSQKLIKHFGSTLEVFRANKIELEKLIGKTKADKILSYKKSMN